MNIVKDLMEPRIARGAAWLDENYPGWFHSVDVVNLELSDCTRCVLGQVWSGHVPEGERRQLVAQVAQRSILIKQDERHQARMIDGMDGFTAFSRLLMDPNWVVDRGFAFDPDYLDPDSDYMCGTIEAWGRLTDAWTAYIIQRRLDAHVEVESARVPELVGVA